MRRSISVTSGRCLRYSSIASCPFVAFGDDLHVGDRVYQRDESLPHHRLVVDDHYSNLVVRSSRLPYTSSASDWHLDDVPPCPARARS